MNTSIGTLRWTLKKASRSAVAHGSRLIKEALPRTRESAALPVRALTYHRFGQIPRDPFCLSLRDFDDQMRYIAHCGLAISLVQLEAFLAGERDLPRDAVLVTVDDGFVSLLGCALPILREYAIPAVAFVSGGMIGKQGPRADAAPEPYLNWDELERLVSAGVTVQSHGWSHRSLCYLDRDEVRYELVRSRELLRQRLGTPVSAFAYPFGTRADYDGAIAAMVGAAGYRFGFTSQHGPIRRGDDALALTRIKIESGETLATFAALVHGGLDAWSWIDRSLWRVQSSRRAA